MNSMVISRSLKRVNYMSKDLKIGIIGAGRIGKMHVENIVSNFRYVEIKAIADTLQIQ